MGSGAGLGSFLNGAVNGYEAMANIQKQQADADQTVKDRAVANEDAQAGLAERNRQRTNAATYRNVAAGQPDAASSLKAIGDASLANGDVDTYAKVQQAGLNNITVQGQQTHASAQNSLQPVLDQINAKIAAGTLSRADGEQLKLNAQQAFENQQEKGKHIAYSWGLARSGDINGAIGYINNSPDISPGVKVAGIHQSADGSQIATVDEQGNPISVVPRAHLDNLYAQYNPAKIEKLGAGESMVSVSPTGAATALTQNGKYQSLHGDNPGVFNVNTGEVKPGLGGVNGVNSPKTARSFVNDAVGQIAQGFGAKLDPITKMMDTSTIKDAPGYYAAISEAENRIRAGEAPMAVASDIVNRGLRKQALGGTASATPTKTFDLSSFGVGNGK